jgi:hypothetical protein
MRSSRRPALADSTFKSAPSIDSFLLINAVVALNDQGGGQMLVPCAKRSPLVWLWLSFFIDPVLSFSVYSVSFWSVQAADLS